MRLQEYPSCLTHGRLWLPMSNTARSDTPAAISIPGVAASEYIGFMPFPGGPDVTTCARKSLLRAIVRRHLGSSGSRRLKFTRPSVEATRKSGGALLA